MRVTPDPGRRTTAWLSERASRRRATDSLGPVLPFRLQEDHRVRAVDRGPQHGVGVVGRTRRDDPEPGRVRIENLGGIAVVLDAANSAAVRNADDDRHLDVTARSVAQFREVARDLLERWIGEGVELNLHDRSQSVHRHADCRADDARLGQWCVEHPRLTEAPGQTVRHSEYATERAHILAIHDDSLVGGKGVGERQIQRSGHADRLISRPSRSLARCLGHAASAATRRACRRRCSGRSAYTWRNRSSVSSSGSTLIRCLNDSAKDSA